MNYADIVRLRFPDHILTRAGDGNVYENLEWSVYNPAPNPIPKATLDAEIALLAAQGLVGAVSDLTPTQENELVAIAQLPENTSGLIYKAGRALYKLDTSQYLTDINYNQVITALGYTPYSTTNPSDYATKSYVDSAATGVIWLDPIVDANLIGNATVAPISPTVGDTYVISTSGNTGAWAGFAVGDFVQYTSTGWELLLANSDVTNGMRFIVSGVTATTATGTLVGHDNEIATITANGGGAGETITWSYYAPSSNNSVLTDTGSSIYGGNSYTYSSTETKWILFQSNTLYAAGDGISLAASTFNINAGAGAAIINDNIVVDVRPSSGLILTLNGTASSLDAAAQLSLEPIGTPGTYRSVTVDSFGRITSGTNPTTLAGYGIIDAQPLDADLTSIASISGTSGLLRKTAADTWGLDTSPYLAATITSPTVGQTLYYNGTQWVNNLPKNFISLNDLLGITVSNPQLGESLYYNGSQWINYGLPGGANGGGAAKRIWSNNIPSMTGTTIVAPTTTPPAVTAGTQIWSMSVTPYSNLASYVVQTSVTGAGTTNQFVTISLFRTTGGVSTYIGGTLQIVQSSNNSATLSFSITDRPNTTQECTYEVRVGITSGTWYINRRNAENTYGGTQTGWVMWEY